MDLTEPAAQQLLGSSLAELSAPAPETFGILQEQLEGRHVVVQRHGEKSIAYTTLLAVGGSVLFNTAFLGGLLLLCCTSGRWRRVIRARVLVISLRSAS